MRINEIITEHIRKVEGGYRLYSGKGKNLGTFPTKAGAEKHEREVQYFKHMSEDVNSEWLDGPHYAKTYRIGNYNYKVENVLHSGDVPGINVTVTDPSRKYAIIGNAYFIHYSDNDNEWLESDETVVDNDYQGMGISSTIYSLVKMLGFSVKPSESLTYDGREMWNAWKAKGNDKHLAEAGGGHYDMPTKETYMIVVSDGTKKRDLVSAESPEEADSIVRSLSKKYPDKTVTVEPRKVVSQQYNEGDVISMKTGKILKPEPMSMIQAFGSDQANIINSLGVSLVEKPSYWEDFEGSGYAAEKNIDEVKLASLSRLLSKSGHKLKTYSTRQIYGRDPKTPQSSVVNMPPEEMFVVQFDNGDRFLADRVGSRSYIRSWAKIVRLPKKAP